MRPAGPAATESYPPGKLSPAASPPHSHRGRMTKDDIDTIESAVNVALARQPRSLR